MPRGFLVKRNPHSPTFQHIPSILSTIQSFHHQQHQQNQKRPHEDRKLPLRKRKFAYHESFDDEVRDYTISALSKAIARRNEINSAVETVLDHTVIETEEARRELAKIENKIGDFICCLCCQKYLDAFELASHACPRIVPKEYPCDYCEKVFKCPANLASHRRWHKKPEEKKIEEITQEENDG